MSDKEIRSLLLESLVNKMEKHKGLVVFAGERSKFEGWLKVEAG